MAGPVGLDPKNGLLPASTDPGAAEFSQTVTDQGAKGSVVPGTTSRSNIQPPLNFDPTRDLGVARAPVFNPASFARPPVTAAQAGPAAAPNPVATANLAAATNVAPASTSNLATPKRSMVERYDDWVNNRGEFANNNGGSAPTDMIMAMMQPGTTPVYGA